MPHSGKLKIIEEVVHRPGGDVLVATLHGTLSLGKESILLRDHLRKRFDEGARYILLVLEHITFMDSSGIGVLVEMKAHAVHGLGDIRLCRCPSFVASILYRLSLHRILEMYETEEAALDKWGSTGSGT
jgi:anti-anti-sigma factor